MNNIIATLESIEKLSHEELHALNQLKYYIKRKTLKRGHYLYESGDTPNFVAFIEFGLLRHFVTDNNDNEKIIQFYKENAFVHDCHCYYEQKPVDYSVQALEDCELSCFILSDVEHLRTEFPVFEKIGRKMLEGHLTNHRDHISLLMKFNPEQRYKYVLENQPELVQRVTVTHLAQYLDLSRETLSRMRAKVVEKNIL